MNSPLNGLVLMGGGARTAEVGARLLRAVPQGVGRRDRFCQEARVRTACPRFFERGRGLKRKQLVGHTKTERQSVVLERQTLQ